MAIFGIIFLVFVLLLLVSFIILNDYDKEIDQSCKNAFWIIFVLFILLVLYVLYVFNNFTGK